MYYHVPMGQMIQIAMMGLGLKPGDEVTTADFLHSHLRWKLLHYWDLLQCLLMLTP